MKIVLPFHQGDLQLANDLLEWCQVLEGTCPHTCLLVPDPEVPWLDALQMADIAERTFQNVNMACPAETCTGGWPSAPNKMFLYAAEQMAIEGTEPWLWLEPDAIPLQPNWASHLANAYEKCGKPYMGALIEGDLEGKGFLYLNGVAVYPGNAIETMGPVIRASQEAFDVACAQLLRPLAANTDLIQCIWGRLNVAPRFGRPQEQHRDNMLSLEAIRPGAVLFHRNKDGSLIDLLSQKRAGANGARLMVVLPFCNRDAALAQKNVTWMVQLGSKFPNKAVLCFPRDTAGQFLGAIESTARQVFSEVTRFICPGNSRHVFPLGANYAFQATARHMQKFGAPWLWLEADAVPLTPNWLSRLEREYHHRRKSFFGPIVENMGHMNGVAIYPANMVTRCPRAMTATDVAWDWILGSELGADVFNASMLIQHCWGIVGGVPHYRDGSPAHFSTKTQVDQWVQPNAVLFHRCKDGSLIDRLREIGNP